MIYVVIQEGNILYASQNRDFAKKFCEDLHEKALRETAVDMGLDIDDEETYAKHIEEIEFQAQFTAKVYSISERKLENDEVCIADDIYQSYDIKQVLEQNGDEQQEWY